MRLWKAVKPSVSKGPQYVLWDKADSDLLEKYTYHLSSVQFSCWVMSDSATPWTAAPQASLSITNSWSLLRLTSIELMLPSNHLNGTPLQYSCLENPMDGGAWKAAARGVTEGRTRLNDFTFTFHFHVLEKEMATHSSVLAWRIPGTGEPGGLPSMGSHRVGHDWSDLAEAALHYKVDWKCWGWERQYLDKFFKMLF